MTITNLMEALAKDVHYNVTDETALEQNTNIQAAITRNNSDLIQAHYPTDGFMAHVFMRVK